MHGFRKIKISNGEDEVILNVADGESSTYRYFRC